MRWIVWAVTVLVWAVGFLSFIWSPTAADHQGAENHCPGGQLIGHYGLPGLKNPIPDPTVRAEYAAMGKPEGYHGCDYAQPTLPPSPSRGRVPRVAASVATPTSTPHTPAGATAASPVPRVVSRPAATPTRGRHVEALPSERATPVVASHSHTSVPALRPTSTPVPSLVCGWGYLREAATGHTYRVRLADCEHIPHGDPRVNVVDWGVLLNGEWTYAAD